MSKVIGRVPTRLPDAIASQFRAVVEPANLALMLTLIALFSLLSGGTALVLGAIAFGTEATLALAAAIQITALAANEQELDQAADALAGLIIIVGVAGFLRKVTSGSSKLRGSGRGNKLPPPKASSRPTKGVGSSTKSAAAGEGRPWSPPSNNSTLQRLRQLSRQELLYEIRKATGEPDIVLWEQVAYGDIYSVVRAGPQAAKKLGVRPGDPIGYKTDGSHMPESSIFGTEGAVPQNYSPHGEPFM